MTMTFENNTGWYYLMTADLEMFRIVVPLEVAREMWTRRNPDAPLSDNNLRAWMACSTLLFFPRIARRVASLSHPRNEDDDRIEVIPVPKTSTLYKGASADRQVAKSGGHPSQPEFAPGVRFMFGADETARLPSYAAARSRHVTTYGID